MFLRNKTRDFLSAFPGDQTLPKIIFWDDSSLERKLATFWLLSRTTTSLFSEENFPSDENSRLFVCLSGKENSSKKESFLKNLPLEKKLVTFSLFTHATIFSKKESFLKVKLVLWWANLWNSVCFPGKIALLKWRLFGSKIVPNGEN